MPGTTRTISDISDEIFGVTEKIKAFEEKITTLKEEGKLLEGELQLAAEAQGLSRGGGKTSTWTLEPVVVPQATDWPAFYAYMAKKKYFHLLQRRPAVKACRELWERGITIPGMDKYTSTRVTVKGV